MVNVTRLQLPQSWIIISVFSWVSFARKQHPLLPKRHHLVVTIETFVPEIIKLWMRSRTASRIIGNPNIPGAQNEHSECPSDLIYGCYIADDFECKVEPSITANQEQNNVSCNHICNKPNMWVAANDMQRRALRNSFV